MSNLSEMARVSGYELAEESIYMILHESGFAEAFAAARRTIYQLSEDREDPVIGGGVLWCEEFLERYNVRVNSTR